MKQKEINHVGILGKKKEKMLSEMDLNHKDGMKAQSNKVQVIDYFFSEKKRVGIQAEIDE